MIKILGKIRSDIISVFDLDSPCGNTRIQGPPSSIPDDGVITYIVCGLDVQEIHTLLLTIQPFYQNEVTSLRNQSEITFFIATWWKNV